MDFIDINCDLGEGESNDNHLLDYVTSCNIACGFHAGDPTTIRRTVENAIEKGVKAGAHPSYNDRENFGRRSVNISGQSTFDLVLYQVSALYSSAMALGDMLHHVKLHGALYNDSAQNPELAEWCFRAIQAVDGELKVYGLPGTAHEQTARKLSLTFVAEGFADRRYDAEGTLVSRNIEGAVLLTPEEVAAQAISIARDKSVKTITGEQLHMEVGTLCFHGDNPNALQNLKATIELLNKNKIGQGYVDN